MPAYQAANANQVPVSQRWNQIHGVKAPFADTSPKSFGFWFNYLWEEARHSEPLPADQAKLCVAFFTVLRPVGPPWTPQITLPQMSDAKKLEVLTTILEIGFERVPLKGFTAGAGGSMPVEKAVSAMDIFAEHMKFDKDNKEEKIHLGFRADGRKYTDLCDQGGFCARARSHKYNVHKDYGLDLPWNPFSMEHNAKCLFLRKGISKDNCLHTVVSVASRFVEILPYPLLSDGTLYKWSHTDFAKWTQGDISASAAHKYKVIAKKDGQGAIDHLESNIRIYVLRMNESQAFSTADWQKKVGVPNPFPEGAVDQVEPKDILAEVEIIRRHYFRRYADGAGELELFEAELAPNGLRFLPNLQVAEDRFGVAFVSELTAKVNGFVLAGQRTLQVNKAIYEKQKIPVVQQAVTAGVKKACPHCGQTFALASGLTAHVPKCLKNPNRVATGFATLPPKPF